MDGSSPNRPNLTRVQRIALAGKLLYEMRKKQRAEALEPQATGGEVQRRAPASTGAGASPKPVQQDERRLDDEL